MAVSDRIGKAPAPDDCIYLNGWTIAVRLWAIRRFSTVGGLQGRWNRSPSAIVAKTREKTAEKTAQEYDSCADDASFWRNTRERGIFTERVGFWKRSEDNAALLIEAKLR